MKQTDNRKGIMLLARAQKYYQMMARFRRERARNKRYNFGDQWGDYVNVDGHSITEEQYIKEQGSIPLKNNLIRRLVRNVIGVYNSQQNQPVCVARDSAESAAAGTLTQLLKYNMQVNRLSAVYTRSLEEFLISGLIVHRKSYGQRGDRIDCWTDYVQPNNFFIDNRMRDFRGWDCSFIGEIHDVTYDAVCRQFATDEASLTRIRSIYGSADRAQHNMEFWDTFADTALPDKDFLLASDPSLCRVIEVWCKQLRSYYVCHDRTTGRVFHTFRKPQGIADAKWEYEDVWHYYFLSPYGDILSEGDTPYAHSSHPYVVKAYPMIDGEIHAFVSDVIDQQRYTNRLITLYDWIMRSSAKGVLLVPEDCVPRGVSLQSFADSWSRYNGVIFYTPSMHGAVPQQVSVNSTNIGIKELLEIQLGFFQDISGVNSALQGKTSNVAISAELYGQQTQNATTTLLDLLDTFSEFVRDAAYKDVKNIQQFYDADRIRRIAGADAQIDAVGDVEFDLSIAPNTSTPSYKQASNELLMEIWKAGQITLEQLLRAGSFPFADELLAMKGEEANTMPDTNSNTCVSDGSRSTVSDSRPRDR